MYKFMIIVDIFVNYIFIYSIIHCNTYFLISSIVENFVSWWWWKSKTCIIISDQCATAKRSPSLSHILTLSLALCRSLTVAISTLQIHFCCMFAYLSAVDIFIDMHCWLTRSRGAAALFTLAYIVRAPISTLPGAPNNILTFKSTFVFWLRRCCNF